MELSVFSIEGKETGKTVTLAESIFGIEPNENAVYLDVKQYLANKRQGTHKAKERSEVRGSTKKLRKQKGSGMARIGSLRSPVQKGGGTVFGPRPRDYSFKLNRKLKALARKSVLSDKAKSNSILVLEDFNFDKPTTKGYVALLKANSLDMKKTLMILPENNNNVYLSSRNLQKAKVTTVNQLSTYELLHADTLIISEKSIQKIEQLLS
jgi:large subunit ribosomal protein L4